MLVAVILVVVFLGPTPVSQELSMSASDGKIHRAAAWRRQAAGVCRGWACLQYPHKLYFCSHCDADGIQIGRLDI